MLLFVIPVFTQIYADSGTKLPMLTNMLVVASNKLKDFSFLIKVIPAILIFLYFAKRK